MNSVFQLRASEKVPASSGDIAFSSALVCLGTRFARSLSLTNLVRSKPLFRQPGRGNLVSFFFDRRFLILLFHFFFGPSQLVLVGSTLVLLSLAGRRRLEKESP